MEENVEMTPSEATPEVVAEPTVENVESNPQ